MMVVRKRKAGIVRQSAIRQNPLVLRGILQLLNSFITYSLNIRKSGNK